MVPPAPYPSSPGIYRLLARPQNLSYLSKQKLASHFSALAYTKPLSLASLQESLQPISQYLTQIVQHLTRQIFTRLFTYKIVRCT